MFVGADFLITIPNVRLQPVEYLFESCRVIHAPRDELFSKGLGLPALQDRRRLLRLLLPDAEQGGQQAGRLEEDIFEGGAEEVVRDISNAKQEIINFRKIIRPQRSVLRDLERTKQRYLAQDLEIYFDDIVDASERIWDMLENYKEVVEALEDTNESVITHRLNNVLRVLTVSVILLPLTLIASIWGMNVHVPGDGTKGAFWIIMGVMLARARRPRRLLPPPRLAVTAPEVRALRAARAVLDAYDLPSEDAVALGGGSNVLVHLKPTPVVARVMTATALLHDDLESWLAREVAVGAFLGERGLAVSPTRLLPPGPHQREGLWMTIWDYVPHDTSGRLPDPTELGHSLRRLHAALAEFAGELEPLLGVRHDLELLLDELRPAPSLSSTDIESLCTRLEQLTPQVSRVLTARAGPPRRHGHQQRAPHRRGTAVERPRGRLHRAGRVGRRGARVQRPGPWARRGVRGGAPSRLRRPAARGPGRLHRRA